MAADAMPLHDVLYLDVALLKIQIRAKIAIPCLRLPVAERIAARSVGPTMVLLLQHVAHLGVMARLLFLLVVVVVVVGPERVKLRNLVLGQELLAGYITAQVVLAVGDG
jgi:hypothetical protein